MSNWLVWFGPALGGGGGDRQRASPRSAKSGLSGTSLNKRLCGVVWGVCGGGGGRGERPE